MADILPLKANSKTAARLRRQRQETKQRLIDRIGIDRSQAPLFEEELALWAYEESLRIKS